MRLNQISDNPGARRSRKRVGRGIASGTGKTAGRGQKGQKSRSGVTLAGFEGGQMPLYRRLPKRGFNNLFRRGFEVVNLGGLQRAIDAKKLDPAKKIDIAALQAAGLVASKPDAVKLLAKGELKAKLSIEVHSASKAAIAAIEAAGGAVSLLAAPTTDSEQTADAPADEGSADA